MSKSKKKKRRSTGTIVISIIVLMFLLVMGVQIYRVKKRGDEYKEKQEALEQQYEAETQRKEEIDALETYMKSSQYIEDTAKSKLGLVYDNEIIFKEKEEDR